MRRTLWQWTVWLSLASSAGCVLLWVVSHGRPSLTISDFIESGRRVALVPGFVYVDVSRPLSSAERTVVRQMDDLQAGADRHEVRPVASSRMFGSDGSGDRWLVLGWVQKWSTRQVGPYGGVTYRRAGLWVSPWAGVLAGLTPLLITRGAQAWQRRIIRRRRSAGLCVRCGYDVRGSEDLCPECGSTVPGRSRHSGQR